MSDEIWTEDHAQNKRYLRLNEKTNRLDWCACQEPRLLVMGAMINNHTFHDYFCPMGPCPCPWCVRWREKPTWKRALIKTFGWASGRAGQ